MPQPIPKVTNEDIERIIKREFPNSSFEEVKEILDQHESNRVKVAAIKNSHGDLDKLKRQIASAKYDSRETLLTAECPNCQIKDMSKEEMKEISEKNWQQYQQWFKK